MNIRQSLMRSALILLIVAVFAAGCGDGEDPAAVDIDPAQETTSPVATTAPLSAGDPDSETAVEVVEMPTAPAEPASPHENIVLEVKDNVGVVPVFDGPNGSEITLYDVNALDEGVRTPYPLEAETYYGNRLALLVDEYDDTGSWAKVFVPVRPNGTTVWVQTAWFEETRNDYHITIDLSNAQVSVFKGEELLRQQTAVLGRESRPTPVLTTYIDERIEGAQLGAAYGTWLLSLASFSETQAYFDNAMPKLALHGTNQPDIMGQYVSSGCVRVPNDVIDFIAETVPVGTLVKIVP